MPTTVPIPPRIKETLLPFYRWPRPVYLQESDPEVEYFLIWLEHSKIKPLAYLI